MSKALTVGVMFGLAGYVMLAEHLTIESRAAGVAIFLVLAWANAREVR